jgi:threonine aldolase
MSNRFSLASDNVAPVHPAILAAIERANHGPAPSYGHDAWTDAAVSRFRSVFGDGTEVLVVANGTAANVLGLRARVDSYHAVLCAETSHLWRDECSAPEHFLGAKLVPIDSPDGKLTPELVRPFLRGFGFVHQAQPRAISVAQPTEWGTVYTEAELRALADLAHEHDMIFHVDGARLANAAVALGVPLGRLGADAGVDVLSFGGTKLGLLAAEAVLFFGPPSGGRSAFYRKQAMQLLSKLRFFSAQLEALLAGDLWHELAGHANAMATRLGAGLAAIDGFELVRPVQTNAVFVRMPETAVEPLRREADFYLWDPADSVARLMTAWNTEPEPIDRFVAAAAALAR